jgi:hypothetical protein
MGSDDEVIQEIWNVVIYYCHMNYGKYVFPYVYIIVAQNWNKTDSFQHL